MAEVQGKSHTSTQGLYRLKNTSDVIILTDAIKSL